jgi:hypothetical protein
VSVSCEYLRRAKCKLKLLHLSKKDSLLFLTAGGRHVNDGQYIYNMKEERRDKLNTLSD